jgi:UDP-N-acetylglucosamine--N-acetylmuramyl-(pentapeptide) pyrophosphoryl-undecaprenol N-acetylglucosamine transferase
MTPPSENCVRVAIACGGTGGHLFPGLAVAGQLTRRGCAVTLLISPKEVDQQGVKSATGLKVATLPAVGLTQGNKLAFFRGFRDSYRAAKELFATERPQAALAMGGFTSAPPILAARKVGAQTFLHESNAVPGRANRWLSWVVDRAFIGFPAASARLHNRRITVTGTPVRSEFVLSSVADCRSALGLDPSRPVLLVMGGSQGASGINDLVSRSLPLVSPRLPELQWILLTGPADAEKVRAACAALRLNAVVHGFFDQMKLALGAATAAISRAGASSLAELAAMRVPAILIPYPAATDQHQLLNAREFATTGAARLIEQHAATPAALSQGIVDLVHSATERERMQASLAKWYAPRAAEIIADDILQALGIPAGGRADSRQPRDPSAGTSNPNPGAWQQQAVA